MEGYVERDKLKEEHSGVSSYHTRERSAIAKFFDRRIGACLCKETAGASGL
jgi:hypothetical protein